MSPRSLVVVLLASMAVTLLPTPADAATAFQFNGRGWGHGIGMSQYGALELARDGHSADRIIAHYYRGAQVASPNLDLGAILIGLSQNQKAVTATARGGAMDVSFAGTDHRVNAGTPTKFEMRQDGRCHLLIDGDEKDTAPACSADLVRRSGAAIELSNENVQYGRGKVLLRPRDNNTKVFHVVARLPDVNTYLYGLREVPASWPTEALRAQVIAGRSYAAYDLLGNDLDRNNCFCHLYDSVSSQVYGGTSDETAAWNSAVDDTADRGNPETAGQVVYAGEGADGTRNGVVQAFYSSSSGGRTENIQDVWGSSPPRPFYSSVDDPYSLRASNPNASWSIPVEGSLIRKELGFDDVHSIRVTSRNESGSARTVVFNGTKNGEAISVTRSGYELRSPFGIRSAWIVEVFLPPFTDDDGNIHESAIAWLAGEGITAGCNPPDNDRYCPDAPVTRAQMASFLTRALGLTPQDEPFTDVDSSNVHAQDIGALADADITKGCNPPDNDRYCPDAPVTRAQMASFLTRALELTPQDEPFTDVDSSNVHARDIGALAARGITRGCNPPDNTRYCPHNPITRAQMATFLHRGMTK